MVVSKESSQYIRLYWKYVCQVHCFCVSNTDNSQCSRLSSFSNTHKRLPKLTCIFSLWTEYLKAWEMYCDRVTNFYHIAMIVIQYKRLATLAKNTSLRPSRIHFSIRKYTSIFVTFYVVKNVIKCQKARSYHS